jgi:NAD(P)-dependent dehydrogenase (short-subunit alcohol dehydrogenase family)
VKRIAVVTGANRGIGREIARQLVNKGLHVIGASRDTREPERDVEPFELDVTRPEHIDALAARLDDGLDVLVNNAGISMRGFDASVARKTLDVNFFGAMHVTDALVPAMRAGGRVVMVSSGLGDISCVSSALRDRLLDASLDERALAELMESFVRDVAAGTHAEHGWPSSAYSVSKVGLNMLARILARDLRHDPRQVLVNAANPGWVRTRMGGSGAPRSVEQGAQTPVWLALLPEGGPSGGFFHDQTPTAW